MTTPDTTASLAQRLRETRQRQEAATEVALSRPQSAEAWKNLYERLGEAQEAQDIYRSLMTEDGYPLL